MEPSDKGKTNTADDQHQLAWSQEIPNYGNKLLKRLDEFRKTTILYDVIVRAEGGDFNAHKVILAACGGLFRTCFVDEKKKMIASEITELSLDCPAQGLKPIIRFAYTGALVVTKRNAVATMIAAEVTKMREVQEICAEIAAKEYGWIIHLVGEKDATSVEELGKVLQLHSPCFTAVQANGNHVAGSERDLPFTEEVQKEFPEHVSTYQKLAIKIESAQDLVAVSKAETKTSADKQISESVSAINEGGAAQKTEDQPASSDSSNDVVSPKPPVPQERPRRTKSDEAKDIKADDASDSKNISNGNPPKKPAVPPSPQVKPSDAANPKPPRPPGAHKKTKSDVNPNDIQPSSPNSTTPSTQNIKSQDSPNQKPPRPSGSHKKNKSDASDNAVLNVVQSSPSASNNKTPKRPSPPPTPKSQATEPPSSKAPLPNGTQKKSAASIENDSVKISVTSEDIHSPETTPKKHAPPPSPRVKPRSSVKSKKAAPAPPPPTLAPPTEKSPKTAAPPRPKAPTKVPPPRPKPPSAKKTSTDPEGAPTKKEIDEIADDYDDSLNPFA